MNIKPLASNITELTIGDSTILFSYETPVAVHLAGEGYKKTSKYWSRTTSKHITKWLNINGFNVDRGDKIEEKDQEWFNDLVNEVK